MSLNNIAFSHLRCNCEMARRPKNRGSKLNPIIDGWINPEVENHGSSGLRKGCRCKVCKTYERGIYIKAYAKRKARKEKEELLK